MAIQLELICQGNKSSLSAWKIGEECSFRATAAPIPSVLLLSPKEVTFSEKRKKNLSKRKWSSCRVTTTSQRKCSTPSPRSYSWLAPKVQDIISWRVLGREYVRRKNHRTVFVTQRPVSTASCCVTSTKGNN